LNKYIEFIETYFVKNGCPLCQKNHKVNLFTIVSRQIKTGIDSITKLDVARILCKKNYHKRKKTGEKLQYTITILPAPLIPYSRIPVETVFSSFNAYITGELKNQYETVLQMNCENRHSFRLYYLRIKNLLAHWYYFFTKGEYKAEEVTSFTTKNLWLALSNFMRELAHPFYIAYWQAYTHAIYCVNKMGLGP
jgi:hypothetical protein